MGLVKELLLLPAAPIRGTGWVLRQVLTEAERHYYDPSAVQQELRRLAERLDNGEIDEAEFDRREDELLDRLEAARTRQMPQERDAAAPEHPDGERR
ncbi:gas vesicle protein GvpG [Streptomyces sp. NPDC003077]|uniref:gas vesicle protein GvpG n=1 Tax=Streptomyces sp. NPDC003077 TaxID=3154443 RepID=UPI0033BE4290